MKTIKSVSSLLPCVRHSNKGRNVSRQETSQYRTLNVFNAFNNSQLVLKSTGRSFLLPVCLHDQSPNQTRYELFYGYRRENVSTSSSSVQLNARAGNFHCTRRSAFTNLLGIFSVVKFTVA